MFTTTTLDRFSTEHIIWMTTVNGKGQPQTSPVWYLWDGEVFWVYSLDPTGRLNNLAVNPKVSLNLNCDDAGSDIVTIDGEAEVVADAPSAAEAEAYVDRYRDRMERGWGGPERFAAKYPTAIRITPKRVRQG